MRNQHIICRHGGGNMLHHRGISRKRLHDAYPLPLLAAPAKTFKRILLVFDAYLVV